MVDDLAEDVEASESWSDEEPSEAGDDESTVFGAKKADGRFMLVGRRAVEGGAVGIAKVVLRGGGGSAVVVLAGEGAT